jgi:bifunctional DNA-binding transcriptional regulator/antitoxin component of YhaV-PrlF toxin-antitoxin module
MSDIYKVIVKESIDGEFYIDLPDELMKSFDWKIGDELVLEEKDVGYVLGKYKDISNSYC